MLTSLSVEDSYNSLNVGSCEIIFVEKRCVESTEKKYFRCRHYTIIDYCCIGHDVMSTREYQYSPRSVLVFSGRHHNMCNAAIVNDYFII